MGQSRASEFGKIENMFDQRKYGRNGNPKEYGFTR